MSQRTMEVGDYDAGAQPADEYDQYAQGDGAGYYDAQQYGYDAQYGYDQYDPEQNPMQEFYPPGGDDPQQQYEGMQPPPPRDVPTDPRYHQQQQQQQQQQYYASKPPIAPTQVPPPRELEQPPPQPPPPPPVRQALLEGYEYEDWTPPTSGWLADIWIETFLSLAFRLYLSLLMWCAGVLIGFLTIDYIFATLYRMFAAPDPSPPAVWQTIAYLAIFFVQSYVTAAIYCTWLDMMKALWRATRSDTALWGFSHMWITGKEPPSFVHFALIFLTLVLPFAWSIGVAVQKQQSVLYVAQYFFYIAIIVTMWLVFICYVWFWWLALVEKKHAYGRRQRVEDPNVQTNLAGVPTQGRRKGKTSWYHSELVLEEYGLESTSIAWSCVVYFVGLIPLFAIYISIARETRSDSPSSTWVAIGLIWITLLLFLQQAATAKRRAYRAAFYVIFLIVLLYVLGFIGCGVDSSGSQFGVMIILLIASQGLLLRKRRHQLTRKEVCELMNIALDRELVDERNRKQWDTYLCCCRNTLFRYLAFLDVKTYFGYRHPAVREREKQLAVQRVALRSDHKVLLVFWLAVAFCLLLVLILGNAVMISRSGAIAARAAGAIAPTAPSLPFCGTVYNANGAVPLTTYDLALLAALGYTAGNAGEDDFSTWFSPKANLVRSYPQFLPASHDAAADGINVQFSVYTDAASDFHVVVLRSFNEGMSLMRNLDTWGESIALQFATIMAPLIIAWPEDAKRSFVNGASFLKQMFTDGAPLTAAQQYITALQSNSSVLLVGDSFNGGYTKILAAQLGVPYVVFNAPGTAYISQLKGLNNAFNSAQSVGNGVQVQAVRSITGYIDDTEDTDATYNVPCDGSISVNECGQINQVVMGILRACGDPLGRTIVS